MTVLIETMTKAMLSEAVGEMDDKELRTLRLRFCQVWDKYYSDGGDVGPGDMTREEMLSKFSVVQTELKIRKISTAIGKRDLDRVVLRRRLMAGLDIGALRPIMLKKDVVAITGDFARSPKRHNTVDVVVSESPLRQRANMDTAVEKVLREQLGERDVRIHYDPNGSSVTSLALFDLVLVPKTELTKSNHIEGSDGGAWDQFQAIRAVVETLEDFNCESVLCLSDNVALSSVLKARGMNVTVVPAGEHFESDENGFDAVVSIGKILAQPKPHAFLSASRRAASTLALHVEVVEEEERGALFDFLTKAREEGNVLVDTCGSKNVALLKYGDWLDDMPDLYEPNEPVAWDYIWTSPADVEGKVGNGNGEVDFKEGTRGEMVIQLHVEHAYSAHDAIQVAADDIMAVQNQYEGLKAKIKNVIEEAASRPPEEDSIMEVERQTSFVNAHLDLRFRPFGQKFWEGGEVFLGGLDSDELVDDTVKLKMGWKRRKDGAVLRGHALWMDAGMDKITMWEGGFIVRVDKSKFRVVHRESDQLIIEFSSGTNNLMQGRWAFERTVIPGGFTWIAYVVPEEASDLTKHEDIEFQFIRKVAAEQIVSGVVYEPDVIDADGDWTSVDEIEKAMMSYMENYQEVRFQHGQKVVNAAVVECFIVRESFREGGQLVRKGSWYQTVKVRDKALWSKIEKGEITGFSMGGLAEVEDDKKPARS